MTVEEIGVGMLVHLNSGSPALTVTEIDRDHLVTVVWINDAGEAQEAEFPVACLKVIVL